MKTGLYNQSLAQISPNVLIFSDVVDVGRKEEWGRTSHLDVQEVDSRRNVKEISFNQNVCNFEGMLLVWCKRFPLRKKDSLN